MSTLYKPEFVEADLVAYITRLLERCHLHRPEVQVCQISQAEENGVGYDACITSICPFYLQLKRSYFYPAISTSDIIKDRSRLALATDAGAYFFHLHPTSKTASELQHNALHRLSQTEVAAYVAPLFFRRRVLLESVPRDYALWAWRYGPVTLVDSETNSVEVTRVRLFHNLITIPPHKTVTDANHRYSYTSPADVCFHSDPERLQGGSFDTFVEFLLGFVRDQQGERGRMRSPAEAARDVVSRLPEIIGLPVRSRALRDIVARGFHQVLGPDYAIPANPAIALMSKHIDPITTLRVFGNILEYEWGIRQYGVVTRAE